MKRRCAYKYQFQLRVVNFSENRGIRNTFRYFTVPERNVRAWRKLKQRFQEKKLTIEKLSMG